MRAGLRTMLCFFVFWQAAAAGAQPDEQIRIVRQEEISLAAVHAGAAVLEVTAVLFVDGGWERDPIDAGFRQGASILAQCGVHLARVTFNLVDAPRRFQFYSTPVSRAFARSTPFPRPTVYFVRDTLNRPAFDAEAIGRVNSRARPELVDTIWVTLATPDLGIALAHELAHLLMDSGAHPDEAGNLMRADTAAENTHLDAAQCARMQRAGRENGLLK